MPTSATTTAVADSATMTVISTKKLMKPSPKPPPSYTPPTYTMKEIYATIPRHCFHRSSLLSFAYIIRDILMALTLLYLVLQIPTYTTSPFLQKTLYILYTFTQGLVFTGLWEIAHESGHFALSTRKWVNYAFGIVIHSFLLVPFHSWRITHSTHHKSTNNLDKDIAFVPDRKEVWEAKREARMSGLAKLSPLLHKIFDTCQDTPIAALLFLMIHQVVAWPTYLILNNFALERMAKVEWWKRSHFYFGGDGPNFKPHHWRDIVLSDLGILGAVGGLWTIARWCGWANVFFYYGGPWLWTNHWILTITFLQHTDPSLPYFPTQNHSFLLGSSSTIDRSFGPLNGIISSFFFHGALETHVLHHHVSRIPFYHAKEASEAVRKVMGESYREDLEGSYYGAFWKCFRKCRFVVPVEGSGKRGEEEVWFFE